MTTSKNDLAKATSASEQSDSIVVSFGAEWHKHLVADPFSLVIRKRVPRDSAYKYMYIYINSPIASICARAEIRSIRHIESKVAISRTDEIKLSPTAIASYIGTDDTIGCYELEVIEVATVPINASVINTRMLFHPPQSFFILSHAGKRTLEDLAKFATSIGSRSMKVRRK